jgi:hypothetical protein
VIGLFWPERGDNFRHEFETRSFPRSLAAARFGFTFYVADPLGSIHEAAQIDGQKSYSEVGDELV